MIIASLTTLTSLLAYQPVATSPSTDAVSKAVDTILNQPSELDEAGQEAIRRAVMTLVTRELSNEQGNRLLDGVLLSSKIPAYSDLWARQFALPVDLAIRKRPELTKDAAWVSKYIGVYVDTPPKLPRKYDLPIFVDCKTVLYQNYPFEKLWWTVSVRRPDGTWRSLGTRWWKDDWWQWIDSIWTVPQSDLSVHNGRAKVTLKLDVRAGTKESDPLNSRTVDLSIPLVDTIDEMKRAVVDEKATAALQSMRVEIIEQKPGESPWNVLLKITDPVDRTSKLQSQGIDTLAVTMSLMLDDRVLWSHKAWWGTPRPAWRYGRHISTLGSFSLHEEAWSQIPQSADHVTLRLESSDETSLRNFDAKTYWKGDITLPVTISRIKKGK